VVVYALVSEDAPKVLRHLLTVATGNPLPAGLVVEPLGLVSMAGGSLMFHVFKVIE
jgi:hypothetical protein